MAGAATMGWGFLLRKCFGQTATEYVFPPKSAYSQLKLSRSRVVTRHVGCTLRYKSFLCITQVGLR